MKIGFTGTHGTGKSTLAKRVAEEYSLPLITGITRQLQEKGYPINEQGTLESQMCIASAQLASEIAAATFVSDRTFIDQLAYATINGLPKEYLDLLRILTCRSLIDYDIIFYIPIQSFILEDDKIRSTDSAYRKAIDLQIQTLLKELLDDRMYIKVSGGFDKEFKEISKILKGL